MNQIINFHLINDIDWFENVVCFLKSKYTFITTDELNEFYQGNINLKNSCHITIDDGDKSFYELIFPVLKKHNVPASLYVSPIICSAKSNYWFQEIIGFKQLEMKRIISEISDIPLNLFINYNLESIMKSMQINQIYEIIDRYCKKTNTPKKTFQNMSVENIKVVDKSGLIEIGAHTMNHPILKNENDISSQYEIKESINELSNILNRKIKYFAYPNGIPELDFSERERKYLKESDILLAFSTDSKNFSLYDDKTSIPRIGISSSENMNFLKTKLRLGSYWGPLTRLKPTGEYSERQKLNRIFSSVKIQNEAL